LVMVTSPIRHFIPVSLKLYLRTQRFSLWFES
jgi:hypothetical protein